MANLEKQSLGRKKKRNKMRDFLIAEISAVDNPAQEHARAILVKRREDSFPTVNKDGKDPYRSAEQTAFSTRQFKPQSGKVRRRRSRTVRPTLKCIPDPEKIAAFQKAQQDQLDELTERTEKLAMSYEQEDAREFNDSRPMSKEELQKLRESPDRVVSVDNRSVFQRPDARFEKTEAAFKKSDFFSKVAQIKKDRNISELRAMQIARQEHPDLYEEARTG